MVKIKSKDEEQLVKEDSEVLKPADSSFRQGWKEATDGRTRPISELWEEDKK